jgi:hypothetical protein
MHIVKIRNYSQDFICLNTDIMCDIRDVIWWINGCVVHVKFGTPWWWLIKTETYVGAVDSVYENTVHTLVLILWIVIMMHGEYNVKNEM